MITTVEYGIKFAKAIKREFGQNPKRSRHCVREPDADVTEIQYFGKAHQGYELESGDLLDFSI